MEEEISIIKHELGPFWYFHEMMLEIYNMLNEFIWNYDLSEEKWCTENNDCIGKRLLNKLK